MYKKMHRGENVRCFNDKLLMVSTRKQADILNK